MVIKIKGLHVIGHPSEAIPAHCSMCQREEELRPYGKGGAWVCFDCAMKDEPTAAEMFRKQFEE